jgi:hypothetical protein
VPIYVSLRGICLIAISRGRKRGKRKRKRRSRRGKRKRKRRKVSLFPGHWQRNEAVNMSARAAAIV